MTPDTTFNYLILGLESTLSSKPQAGLLNWACHSLALAMPARYPRTSARLFRLFEMPLKEWYPYPIPRRFDSNFGLLYDGELSEEASDYCDELVERTDLPNSLLARVAALENVPFREMFDELKAAYELNPETAQKEYVLLRKFLIEQPHTTTEQLVKTFFRGEYITPKKVSELYEQLPSGEPLCGVWECDRCGPLTSNQGQLRGLKPSVCNDHRVELDKVRRIDWQPELRRLKPAIHRRVCIPGIPELALFSNLKGLCNLMHPGLHTVQLYPGVDCYDLRLQFSDGKVWAVDVKDYPNPHKLTDRLVAIYGPENLRYNKGFYVVPQAYIRQTKDYLRLAKGDSPMKGMQLVGEHTFNNRVVKKIKQLQSKET